MDTEKIKETGRKAHIRLEQEKSKRKEIKRLDSNYHHEEELSGTAMAKMTVTAASAFATQPTKRKRTAFSQSVQQSSKKKRTRQTSRSATRTTTTTNSTKKRTRGASTSSAQVDMWTPRIPSIQEIYKQRNDNNDDDNTEEQKTNVIRLHGLPLGVTLDHIRKFFSGLTPDRIFTIPSLDVHIPDFDSIPEDKKRIGTKQSIVVQRHPSHFRVFVKFPSHLIAEAALGRNGETITVPSTSSTSGNSNNTESNSKSAAIVMTPVPKTIAHHLQKYMSIEGKRGRTITLAETTLEVESKLPKTVRLILWIMARQKLGWDKLDLSSIALGDSFCKNNDKGTSMVLEQFFLASPTEIMLTATATTTTTNQSYFTKKEEYQKCARIYNKLWDIHEELLIPKDDGDDNESTSSCADSITTIYCSPTQLHQFDPSNMVAKAFPVQHLIRSASDWLLDQLNMIKTCIAHYRMPPFD